MVVKKEEAQTKQNIANELIKTINIKTQEIQSKKGPIMKELSEAQPAVENAKKAISDIDKRKLDELKMMAKPPELIKLAMEAVLLIVGNDAERSDVSWENVKKAMRRPEFLKNMVDYNPDTSSVPNGVVKKLKSDYIENPKLSVEQVMRASQAAGPMYSWVCSVMRYQEIVKKIEPLTNEINSLEKEESELKEKLQKAQGELGVLTSLINEYETQYRLLLQKQTELDNDKQKTEQKLNRASGLINSLQSEGERWSKQCSEFDQKLKNSAGDQLLISFY